MLDFLEIWEWPTRCFYIDNVGNILRILWGTIGYLGIWRGVLSFWRFSGVQGFKKSGHAASIHCCKAFLHTWPVRICQKYVNLYVTIRRQKRVVRTYVRIVVYTYLWNLCHLDVADANLKLARHYSSYGKWRFTKRSTTFGWMSSRFQDKTFSYTRFTSLRASQEILPLCVAKIDRAIAISAQEKNIIWDIEKRFPKPVLSTVQSLIGFQEWPKPWTPSLLQRVWVFYTSLQVANCKSRNLSLGIVNRFEENI